MEDSEKVLMQPFEYLNHLLFEIISIPYLVFILSVGLRLFLCLEIKVNSMWFQQWLVSPKMKELQLQTSLIQKKQGIFGMCFFKEFFDDYLSLGKMTAFYKLLFIVFEILF